VTAESGALGKVHRDGELIIRQGDVGECMYVIQEGQARVFIEKDGREVYLRTAEEGEIIGEMAVFERAVRSATVRAHGVVRVLTVDKRTFLARINEDPSLAFRVVETMSRRIRELSSKLALLEGRGEGSS
jgi:CRP-like cAMP-binding protein